jgi:hypothetical protein
MNYVGNAVALLSSIIMSFRRFTRSLLWALVCCCCLLNAGGAAASFMGLVQFATLLAAVLVFAGQWDWDTVCVCCRL